MGRTEPSVGQPPASFRRDARAKKAKATVNQLIPSLLPTYPRARRGIEATELIVNPPPVPKNEQPKTEIGPRLTLQVTDTLTAARTLLANSISLRGPINHTDKNKVPKVAILNMASPLSPGGGFLNGAGSQEESLCMRTTLLPSLKDEYYRLPELGAVYTPDVLVFRDEMDELLEKKDRWFVDCITAAMLRGPETDRDDSGRGAYANEKDREMALQKMRMVLRICQAKGVKKVVLGAWGCGAYGNPVGEIAAAWRKVLLPRKDGKNKNKRETWDGLEDVAFAIKDAGMAESFGTAFGDGLVLEAPEPEDDGEDEEVDLEEVQTRELQARIDELEQRIETTANPQVKKGLLGIREGLLSQLSKK
ncbi:hypothetical protein B0J13DRAFT_566724 [Dactylonectria estremocensis]|uniref:Microbial-type PARG catalytic domain-containing protein n=1 Tax=Dactylonectria estremocensis TaxID=1079267 RepID=A0A9P9DPV8_9HYPO|nr:hypothetical protein B0J13DRAFT_566724 [Dactylonectria estremocensis]